MTDLDADLDLALRLADAADAIARERFEAADLTVTTKPDRTPVTDADRAIELGIRDAIAAARPGDAILGEEFGGERAAGRQWIVDPIDGTTNFLRGQPIWATLIALAVDGVPVVGVASAPALGRRWWAARDRGAWTAETPGGAPALIGVSSVTALEDAFLTYNSLQGWDGAADLDALLALSRSVWRTRALGDFWGYVLVAEGRLDVAAEHDLKVYDMAALVPILEEAGGRFTDLDGTPGPWGGTALATNGLLHDAVLTTTAAARAAASR